MTIVATNVTASDGLPNGVNVSWTQPNNTKAAQVCRSTIKGQAGTVLATVKKGPYTDNTAAPGVAYYYGIKLQGPNGPYGPLSVQDTGSAAVVTTPVSITTTSVPNGQVGVAYATQLAAIGGTPPYAWNVSVGSLPPGLALNPATGQITGTPSASGSYSFTARVQDANLVAATYTYSMSVAAVQTGNSPPVWQATPPSVNFTQGVAGSVVVPLNVTDPDGDPLTLTLDSPLPAGVTVTGLPAVGVTTNPTNVTFAYDGVGVKASSNVVIGADDLK